MVKAKKRSEKEIPDVVIGIIMLAIVMIILFFSMVTSLRPPTGQAIIPTTESGISVVGMFTVIFIALYFIYRGTKE